jgi:hypothetical protein
MNNFKTKFKAFFYKNKYLLIPAIPLFFFLGLLFYIPTTQQTKTSSEPSPAVNPTTSQNKPSITQIPTVFPTPATEETVEEEDLSKLQGLITKEALADGTTKYIVQSTNPNRPEIYIAYNDHNILFERDIISPRYPVQITDYTKPYGQPERMITGSIFYGPNTQTLIYAKEGMVIVGNPAKNQVYEQHLFEPMTVAEYIQKYGDDIPVDKRQ